MSENKIQFDISQYEVIEKIGNGDNADVYLIKSKIDNRKVYAAKKIRKKISLPEEQALFDNEVEILKKANNPAIIKYIDTAIDEDELSSIITDYYPYTLSNLITFNLIEKKVLSSSKKYLILIGITKGMSFLHSNKILHRNIRAENIVLDDNYHPYICDFSQSKMFQKPLKDFVTQTITGSITYSAPEIIDGYYDYKIDIFSFGILCYELITGKKKNKLNFKDFCEKNKELDFDVIKNESLKTLLESCCSQNPSERPDFNQILKILKEEEIRKFFEINDDEVRKYLAKFNDTIEGCTFTEYAKNEADKGNVDFIIQYANILKEGMFVRIDLKEASAYFKLAADKGDVNSMFEYANILYNSDNVEENKDEIRKYFEMAIEGGSDIAILTFGSILYEGKEPFEKDIKKCLTYLEGSVNLGNYEALKLYLRIKYNEHTIKDDANIIHQFIKICSDKGNAEAIEMQASILEENDPIESIKYYKIAADKGNVSAMGKYAFLLSKINKEEIMNCYRKSVETKSADEMQKYAFIIDNMSKQDVNESYKVPIETGNFDKVDRFAYLVSDIIANETTKYYLRAIEGGNIDAVYNYAKLLYNGEDRGKNIKKIANLYKKAAEGGDARSMYEYSYFLEKGIVFEIDLKSSLSYLKKSAEMGYKNAILIYGLKIGDDEKNEAIKIYKNNAIKGNIYSIRMYANEIRKTCKYEAFCWYRIAADSGDVESMINYAQMAFIGECFPPDKVEALRYFKKAADRNNDQAIVAYAEMCYKGDGVPVNYKESVRYYLKAMDHFHDNVEARIGYARALYEGKGVKQNKAYAAQQYKQAADKNDVQSMVKYANMLYEGDGVEKDRKIAFEYYEKAAEQGDPESKFKCGNMLFNGDGVEVNKARSFEYYKEGASLNNYECMFMYASMLFNGENIAANKKCSSLYYTNITCDLFNGEKTIPIDRKEAAQYFKKAADEGKHVKSMLAYAEMKFHSVCKEISVDELESASYYERAANIGNDVNAIHFLAMMNYFGCKEVPANKDVAAFTFKRAADLGHVDSMRRYASMLLNGDGIDRDNELGTHYIYLCAQSQSANDDDYVTIFLNELNYIKNKNPGSFELPNELNFFYAK